MIIKSTSRTLYSSTRALCRASRSGQPSPDGSLEAHEREDFSWPTFSSVLAKSQGISPWAHAMVAQLSSHGPVVLSAPNLIHGIQAQVQVQVHAAVGAHDTIPMSQYLAHHWRLDVP